MKYTIASLIACNFAWGNQDFPYLGHCEYSGDLLELDQWLKIGLSQKKQGSYKMTLFGYGVGNPGDKLSLNSYLNENCTGDV